VDILCVTLLATISTYGFQKNYSGRLSCRSLVTWSVIRF